MQDELRLRVRMITAAIVLSAVLLAAVGVWIVLTWDQPHRGGLAAVSAASALATAAIALLPHGRIVASRWREPFFLAWSLALVVFITVAAGLDDGVRSPVVFMLFLTVVYAALSYPRGSVGVVAVASLLAVMVLSQVAGRGTIPPDPVYLGGLMLTLAIVGVMCIWQARIQEEHRRRLARLSRADPLTGTLNRLGFGERLEAELARCRAGEGPLGLVLVDFDGFKLVNDEHGHAAGDDLLCWAAQAMSAALRPDDALGRLGGDEFAVALPGADAEEAAYVAERLRLVLAARIPASTGVAAAPGEGSSAESLHRVADARLYAAKRTEIALVPAR